MVQDGNIGNIVHELIHVSVMESNPDVSLAPARKYEGPGQNGFPENEAARQGAIMRENQFHNLNTRMGCLSDETQLQKDIASKMQYAKHNPHLEFDTWSLSGSTRKI